jgi:hypothetical protein
MAFVWTDLYCCIRCWRPRTCQCNWNEMGRGEDTVWY